MYVHAQIYRLSFSLHVLKRPRGLYLFPLSSQMLYLFATKHDMEWVDQACTGLTLVYVPSEKVDLWFLGGNPPNVPWKSKYDGIEPERIDGSTINSRC